MTCIGSTINLFKKNGMSEDMINKGDLKSAYIYKVGFKEETIRYLRPHTYNPYSLSNPE